MPCRPRAGWGPAGPGEGGCRSPGGRVVLPPARLQIAVAAGRGERGAAGREGSPLPLGQSAGRTRGRGERRSKTGTKGVAGAGCGRGVPG